MYKNYIFDVYGTLIDIHTNEYEASAWSKLAETLSFYGVNYTPEELEQTYFSSCDWQMNSGAKNYKHPEVDVVEVFRQIFENKGAKAGKSLATHLAQQFRAFTTQRIGLYDGVADTLTKLKKAGKKLYVVANAQSCYLKQEMAKLGLRKYFSGTVYSSDYRCALPEPALLNALIDKHKLEVKQCVYIGNNPKIFPKHTVNTADFGDIAKLLLKK